MPGHINSSLYSLLFLHRIFAVTIGAVPGPVGGADINGQGFAMPARMVGFAGAMYGCRSVGPGLQM